MSWISIFEELPPGYEWVLVIDSEGGCDVAYLNEEKDITEVSEDDIKEMCFHARHHMCSDITHWRKLPDPPLKIK